MAHGTLIDGTVYEIGGGRTLVDGTGYDIDNGIALVDGTAYEVGFGPNYVESEGSVSYVLLDTATLRNVYIASGYTINDAGQYVLKSPTSYKASSYVYESYLVKLTSTAPRYVMLGASTGNVMYRMERSSHWGNTYYQYIVVGYDDWEVDDYIRLDLSTAATDENGDIGTNTNFTKMTITET